MEHPVGERIRFWGHDGIVIGVVKNFHHVSLHRDIMPQIIVANPDFSDGWRYIFVKITTKFNSPFMY